MDQKDGQAMLSFSRAWVWSRRPCVVPAACKQAHAWQLGTREGWPSAPDIQTPRPSCMTELTAMLRSLPHLAGVVLEEVNTTLAETCPRSLPWLLLSKSSQDPVPTHFGWAARRRTVLGCKTGTSQGGQVLKGPSICTGRCPLRVTDCWTKFHICACTSVLCSDACKP